MTELELLEAIQTGLEAFSTSPLSDFEVYILPQVQVGDESIVLTFQSQEEPQGMTSGGGRFTLNVEVTMTAVFYAADTSTNRDKAFNVLKQLRKWIRNNRSMTVGDEDAQYAQSNVGEITVESEGQDDQARDFRVVSLTSTWRVPEDTS